MSGERCVKDMWGGIARKDEGSEEWKELEEWKEWRSGKYGRVKTRKSNKREEGQHRRNGKEKCAAQVEKRPQDRHKP